MSIAAIKALEQAQPDIKQSAERVEPVVCLHKRYSVNVHDQIGYCLDCKAEGRMKFVVDDTSTPQRQPLTDWISVDERLPDVGGYYLVTVATDDGPHVDVLLFDEKRKHWEHEGEPTFCHSYYFEPTHWAHRPEAAHGITRSEAT